MSVRMARHKSAPGTEDQEALKRQSSTVERGSKAKKEEREERKREAKESKGDLPEVRVRKERSDLSGRRRRIECGQGFE